MHEFQLFQHRRAELERVRIRHADAAVQAIEHVGQREPVAQRFFERAGFRWQRDLVQFRFVGLGRLERQPARVSRFQRIDHVQVVGPGFGPVFPRVRCSVAADEALFPVGDRTVLVVPLECVAIILALVAEQRAVAVDPWCIGNQAVEIIVAALVTEVTQQRAITFVHLFARALALGRIGFGDVQRDQAIVVAGHHALVGHAIFEELECQAGIRLDFFRGRGQVQLRQREQQAALGGFEARPQDAVLLRRQRRDHHRELA